MKTAGKRKFGQTGQGRREAGTVIKTGTESAEHQGKGREDRQEQRRRKKESKKRDGVRKRGQTKSGESIKKTLKKRRALAEMGRNRQERGRGKDHKKKTHHVG